MRILYFMQLPEAVSLIEKAMNTMSDRFKRTLFDEWAVISGIAGEQWLLHYYGNREDAFKQSFVQDFKALHNLLEDKHLAEGDFEFTKEGAGTRFDAILCLGANLYLVCNNLSLSMQEITEDPLWRPSQGPFVTLSERFQVNPLVLS